jgi:hypothetical protein
VPLPQLSIIHYPFFFVLHRLPTFRIAHRPRGEPPMMFRFPIWLSAPILIAAAAQFVAAQSPLPMEVAWALRASKSAAVVLLDPSVASGFASLIRNEALAEYNLQTVAPDVFKSDPEKRAWVGSMSGPNDRWLVVGSRGQFVAKGRTVPTAAELAQQLASNGVVSPERFLRQFVRQNPGNQEARTELINLLHKKAIAQTIKALGIVPETNKREIEADATSTGWSGGGIAKPADKSKMLGSEEDLVIWAMFGQEMENLFADGSWMAAPLSLEGYLAEAHSLTMQAVYGRRLAQVQDALITMSSNYNFWQLWVRFKSTIPDKTPLNFLNEIKPVPPELGVGNNLINPQIVNLLVEDARAHGDWAFVRELLWSQFNAEFPPRDLDEARDSRLEELYFKSDSIEIYNNFIELLIEALVKCEQENLVLDVIYRFKDRRGDIPNLNTRLTNLAKRLNKSALAPSWISQ